jgi:hypothetical protein
MLIRQIMDSAEKDKWQRIVYHSKSGRPFLREVDEGVAKRRLQGLDILQLVIALEDSYAINSPTFAIPFRSIFSVNVPYKDIEERNPCEVAKTAISLARRYNPSDSYKLPTDNEMRGADLDLSIVINPDRTKANLRLNVLIVRLLSVVP